MLSCFLHGLVPPHCPRVNSDKVVLPQQEGPKFYEVGLLRLCRSLKGQTGHLQKGCLERPPLKVLGSRVALSGDRILVHLR